MVSKQFTSVLASLSLLLGLAGSASAQEAYVRSQDEALQVAVGHFHAENSDVEVILYGVVHVAESDYYATVQEDLSSYTTVLYEGVGPAPGEEPVELTEAEKAMGDMQGLLGELLGLTFQKDGIDYTQPNLVHADMSMTELRERLGGGSVNPMGQMMSEDQLEQMAPMLRMAAEFGKMMMESNPGMRQSLKLQMAGQLTGGDAAQQLSPEMTQVILIDRNEVAFNVLREQLQTQTDGTIAIFYGAAHMPDLEERLAEIGFELSDKRWLNAWDLSEGGPAVAPAPADEAPEAAPADGSRWFK
jgi:hypothetical protein